MSDHNTTPASTPATPASPTPPIHPRRKWGFRVIVLCAAWLAIEVLSFSIVQFVVLGGMTGIRERQMEFQFMAKFETSQFETLHPYIGWVHNPDFRAEANCCGTKLKANRYGFLDSSDGVQHRSPDRLIVAIAGGSVAWQMSCAGAEALRKKLQEVPEYKDREIILVRIAQSGFKQPQALFALNYYLLQGGEFDIVIALDGYNEISLPAAENFFANVALDYPQGWQVRTLDIVDPRDADFSLKVFEIRGVRQHNALAAIQSPFRYLPSYQLLWFTREERMRDELLDIQTDLQNRNLARKKPFIHSGPHPTVKTQDEAIEESVRLWKQSTLQMAQICEANQILFIQAIQPNQYDPGSKPLSDFEKAKCYGDEIEYGKIVKQGYPQLRAAGAALRSQGVRHYDLTQIFAQTTDTLYIDPYCHVNQRGSEMLAEALGDRVIESLSLKIK